MTSTIFSRKSSPFSPNGEFGKLRFSSVLGIDVISPMEYRGLGFVVLIQVSIYKNNVNI